MFKSKAMQQLIQNRDAKKKEAETLLNKGDATTEELDTVNAEIKAIKAKIQAQEAVDEGREFDANGMEIKDMTPVNKPLYAEANQHKKPFNSFGEQMQAIVNSSKPGTTIDNRLLAVQNAASGANESIPAEGGFLVQQDFATELLKDVYETGVLAKKCRKIPISANANSIKMNAVDESSRATGSRWGGVRGYWAAEAGAVTESQPKFRKVEIELFKLMAISYGTEELIQDAAAMESILKMAFTDELGFLLDEAILRGDGSGKPLGILNAGCLVTQAKESGQAAATMLYENIINIWSRLLPKSRKNAEWYINLELEPLLYSMSMAIGTGGVPVYLPAGGISGEPYGTLFGRPVVPIEQASAPGTIGDITLADLSEYMLIDKGGANMESSIHVRFLYDELAFRITYRVGGQPLRSKTITPNKGTKTLSSFVTLATRA